MVTKKTIQELKKMVEQIFSNKGKYSYTAKIKLENRLIEFIQKNPDYVEESEIDETIKYINCLFKSYESTYNDLSNLRLKNYKNGNLSQEDIDAYISEVKKLKSDIDAIIANLVSIEETTPVIIVENQDETQYEEVVVEEPVVDETQLEEVAVEEPVADETQLEEVAVEEPVSDETQLEEVAVEESVSDETQLEEVVVEEDEEAKEEPEHKKEKTKNKTKIYKIFGFTILSLIILISIILLAKSCNTTQPNIPSTEEISVTENIPNSVNIYCDDNGIYRGVTNMTISSNKKIDKIDVDFIKTGSMVVYQTSSNDNEYQYIIEFSATGTFEVSFEVYCGSETTTITKSIEVNAPIMS